MPATTLTADRRTTAGRRLTDSIDPDLVLLQRLAGSRASANTLLAAARVLARAGMSDAHALLLERADQIIDEAARGAVRS